MAGARPNFMKLAPLYHALAEEEWVQLKIIHTGQHYDANMDSTFFEDLRLPEPDVHMGIGSGSHAEQTGKIMMGYEQLCQKEIPHLTIVMGDVNSTLATSIACAKMGVPVGHLEAGLRSFDRSMPEEVNRVLTDAISDILWTPSADADANLMKEGVSPEKIHRVGNIMIDSIELLRPKIEEDNFREKLGLTKGEYALVTLHRPSNVDDPKKLENLCLILKEMSREVPIVFPVHPRTGKNLKMLPLFEGLHKKESLTLIEPVGYIQFMNLLFNARMVVTDSGGLQEETTYLHIPCLTLRGNTERPITITMGTNRLSTLGSIRDDFRSAMNGHWTKGKIPEYWDGKTAGRVVSSLEKYFGVTVHQ